MCTQLKSDHGWRWPPLGVVWLNLTRTIQKQEEEQSSACLDEHSKAKATRSKEHLSLCRCIPARGLHQHRSLNKHCPYSLITPPQGPRDSRSPTLELPSPCSKVSSPTISFWLLSAILMQEQVQGQYSKYSMLWEIREASSKWYYAPNSC
jgi:hypothetical protein